MVWDMTCDMILLWNLPGPADFHVDGSTDIAAGGRVLS